MVMKRVNVLILIIITISSILLSSISSTQISYGQQTSQTSFKDWATTWKEWASIAWRYFQSGVGVDSYTGLHYATTIYHIFTDWDLGTYIMAILDAEKIGLIPSNGTWGADYRLNKIFDFLENRPLRSDGEAYWAYDAATGKETGGVTLPSDAGNLLLALDQVRTAHPEYASRIASVLQRQNFTGLASDSYFSNNDFYVQYSAGGFQAFGIAVPQLWNLSNMEKGQFVDVYGESIPKTWVTAEPLVLSLLEGKPNQIFEEVSYKVFKAQEKRYEDTGVLTAFSEGMYPTGNNYVYEWIVTGSGETWKSYYYQPWIEVDDPAIFTKIAFAYYALYPSDYSKKLIDYVSSLETQQGFYEGYLESGGVIGFLSDKTNGMILQAARYALSNPVKSNFNTEYTSPNSLQSQISLTRNNTGISNATINYKIYYPNSTALTNLSNKTDSNGQATFNVSLPEMTPSGNYTIQVQALSISNSTVIQVINPKNPIIQTNDTPNTIMIIAILAIITLAGTATYLLKRNKGKQPQSPEHRNKS